MADLLLGPKEVNSYEIHTLVINAHSIIKHSKKKSNFSKILFAINSGFCQLINIFFSYIQGLVVLDRDKRRFSDIMEEKANKLGKSWKEPGKKIKLVSRLSQSDVKDVKQEGMVHSRAFNKVVAPEKKVQKLLNYVYSGL